MDTMLINENEAYHADTTHISKSGLDMISKAPAKYYNRYLNPNRQPETRTEALVVGSAFHCLVLEPEKFRNEFFVMPNFTGTGSQTKKNKMMIDNIGKQALKTSDYEEISRMRDSIMNNPVAKQLFDSGFAEKRFNWIDPDTGAKCKIKPDWYADKHRSTVDLKTTIDASAKGFERSAFKFRYHVQSPFYTDGLIENGINPESFIFIAIEKEPPYLVNVFFADDEMMEYGRETYKNDLKIYMQCKETGIWTGYGNEIKPLSIPGFAKK